MKVKLSMINCSFKVDGEKKTVVAIIETKSKIGPYSKKLKTVGVAKCDTNDTYDAQKGMRLARARAEKEAYIIHRNRLEMLLKSLNENCAILSMQLNKTKQYISHQKEYIKSF